MKYSKRLYLEQLYPLQDGVMKLVNISRLPFFLTGGTAISRFYFQHRFSDDLDYFLNDSPDYKRYVQEFENLLHTSNFEVDESQTVTSESHHRFIVFRNQVQLKIDLVNDIAFRVGTFWHDVNFGFIDCWENILSNKISAIYRFAPKDIADIHEICLHKKFSWPEVIDQARKKDIGISADFVAEIIMDFPIARMADVIWNKEYAPDMFQNNLSRIATDILKGADNSLCTQER